MLIRPARSEDALAVAQVHVRSWQTAYRGLLPDEYLDGLRAEARAATYKLDSTDPQKPFTMVAADDERIVGFASTMPARDKDLAGYGELCALYVDPDRWGKGIGVALVGAARNRLMESGFEQAALWVLVGNVRAERFYRNDGWAADGLRRADTLWGVTVEEFRYQRRL
jgi:ribosomal protein S18 acetylase RimI-like enzyme